MLLRPQGWPNFEPDLAQIEEGFSLELNPLLSLDGRTVDAVIRCNIDQLERLVTVMLDVPSPAAPRQRTKIEVPQASHYQLHERFAGRPTRCWWSASAWWPRRCRSSTMRY